MTKEPILNYDPLPPPDSIDIYNMKELGRRQTQQGRGGILNMLLDSLWQDLNAQQPNNDNLQMWVHTPLLKLIGCTFVSPNTKDVSNFRPNAQPQVDGENPPIALGAGLQQSVTALLDAMRDLLTNANARQGDAADGEDSASDGEQRPWTWILAQGYTCSLMTM